MLLFTMYKTTFFSPQSVATWIDRLCMPPATGETPRFLAENMPVTYYEISKDSITYIDELPLFYSTFG